MTMKKETLKTVIKNVKHVFTADETAALSVEFRQAYANLKAVEADVTAEKSRLKARTDTAQAAMDLKNSTLQAGFENRDEKCVVILDLKGGKKHFHLESSLVDGKLPKDAVPILTEAITDSDRQQELLEAESQFEAKEDIELFKPTGQDIGVLTVGRLNGKWFSALRVKIGTRILSERLDSEQPASKKRADQIKRTAKRFDEWLKENLGHEEAKGFQNALALVVTEHAEREE